MWNSRFGFGIALFVVNLVGSLSADETPFTAIPAQTGLVLRFKSPAGTIHKAAAFVDQVLPGGQILKLFQFDGDSWGDVIRSCHERLVESVGADVDMHRDWWMFCGNPIGDLSNFSFAVPATDVEGLQASIREANKNIESVNEFETIIYKSWVIYVSKADAEAVRQCISGQKASIEDRFTAEALAVFLQGDIGAIVDVRHLMAVNAEMLDQFSSEGLLKTLMECLPMSFNGPVGNEAGNAGNASSKTTEQFASALFQGITDTELLAVSLAIEDDEIRFHHVQSVKPDSPTAAFFRANPGSEMEVLSSLPPFSSLILGYHGNQKALTAWVTEFLRSNMSTGDEPGLTKAQEEIRKGFEELNYGTCAVAYPMRPVEQGVFRSVLISEVDNPIRARELDIKWSELPQSWGGTATTLKASDSRTTETYGEFSAEVFSVPNPVQSGDANLDKSFEKFLYGPDGLVFRAVCLKDRIIECVGGTKARTVAAIRHIADHSRVGTVGEPHFMKTREKLGKNANLIVMIDTGGIGAVLMNLWNLQAEAAASAMDVNEPPPGAVLDDDEQIVKADSDEEPADAERPRNGQNGIAIGTKDVLPEDAKADKRRQENEERTDISLAKFDQEAIDSVQATPSLIGLSLSFEPQVSRFKIVIPKTAIQHIVKAGAASIGALSIDLSDGPAAEEMEGEDE